MAEDDGAPPAQEEGRLYEEALAGLRAIQRAQDDAISDLQGITRAMVRPGLLRQPQLAHIDGAAVGAGDVDSAFAVLKYVTTYMPEYTRRAEAVARRFRGFGERVRRLRARLQ